MRQLLIMLVCAGTLAAQSERSNHVQWKMTLDQSSAAPGATVMGRLQAVIDPEWHMYSLSTPPGPIPTTIQPADGAPVQKLTIFEPPPVRKFDPSFNADTETYEGAQTFIARIDLQRHLLHSSPNPRHKRQPDD
jgi:hypothetical protein